MNSKSVKEHSRSIRFPKFVWEALDKDAKVCGRSSSKQLEQLVRVYYELDVTEIDHDKVRNIDLKPGGTGRANEGEIELYYQLLKLPDETREFIIEAARVGGAKGEVNLIEQLKGTLGKAS